MQRLPGTTPETSVTNPRNDPADSALMQACARGDQSAWRMLVDRYARLVYSIPRSCRLPDDVCEDVSQIVFQTLFRRLGHLGAVRSLSAWLIRVAQRECWRQARTLRQRRAGELADMPVRDPTPEMLDTWERRYRVDRGLRELGGRCEELLRLLFLDPSHPSYQSIAARLGVPIGSIGAWRGRCLGTLLEILRDSESGGTHR